MEQIRLLQQNLESRLKVLLPDDVGAALMDGVVLCHLANHIRPRSVASIHVPSPAVPKLSMAKCRRNVENFLDACKKLGVPQVGPSVSSFYKCHISFQLVSLFDIVIIFHNITVLLYF
uniref:Calponin-homology (CH) domain-containing protein n=1 Tax=Sinocyclocheilus rhinocerous TaxID=307959 RepID=A0A673NEA3_9TELE